MSDFEYAGHRGPDGWVNPAVAEILVGRRLQSVMYKLGTSAAQLYAGRVRKRTGRLANSVEVSTEKAGANFGSKPDRWTAVVEAKAPYSAAVEFGKVNTAREHPRPQTKRRIKPGTFPARTGGAHDFGGDNRRIRSVVAWIEGNS
ncbi:hypothetical protein IU485_28015 [Nocardia cyriacigeorgica]|uniref:hypothetical protein n=1 Tax=Nocardia cyriacigeorgica TaxID=135487 RepID=UPI0018960873|nr:hypothetical protein [Nocardia cyriacigeorgica]MBF6085219.1 hypothetical protein [Nocardia cyriacigeorgica]